MKKILTALMLALCILACTMGSALASVLIVSSTTADDDSEALYQNLDRAIAALNGGVIEKGKPFSFNEVVGPRTAENGYTSASNGNGVSVMGGGVSQVATTLHLALQSMSDDVTYEELHAFGSAFRAGYVETAAESVLTDYARNLDYRFTSNHAENLFISMWRSDGMVFCQLTGIGAETETLAPNPDATPTPNADNAATKQMRVINVNSYVNLRAAASTQSESLIQIPKDAVVEYAGEQDGDFLKVSYEGKTGYVHSKYLGETIDAPATLEVVNCKQSVTLRAEPSRNAAALADVPLGAEVEDAGIMEGEFRKVVYRGKEGYILISYLTEA